MAITGSDRGTGGNNTASTSQGIVPTSNFTSGSLALLAFVYDNTATNGADPFTTISDTNTNTWSLLLDNLIDPGTAGAGSVFRLYSSTMNNGTLDTGDTITVSFSNATKIVWTLTELYGDSGPVTNIGLNYAEQTNTITSDSLDTGQAILGVYGRGGNSMSYTEDTDTTNGSWSAGQSTSVGTGSSSFAITSQYKIVTASGQQTYNVSASAGEDRIVWASFNENVIASTDPFGQFGIFGI